MAQDTDQLYREGVTAIRAGDKATAREKLMQVVKINPAHEQAWLWLSGVVEDEADRIICLQNALTLNPDSEPAQRGLEKLGVSTAVDVNLAGVAEEPPHSPDPLPEPSYRLKHSTAPAVDSLFNPSVPRRADERRYNTPDEGWRAALEELPLEAIPNTGKYVRDLKGSEKRVPRDLLDLVNTWINLIILRTKGEFELEFRNAGFAHIMANIVMAGLLLSLSGIGFITILSRLDQRNITPPVVRSFYDLANEQEAADIARDFREWQISLVGQEILTLQGQLVIERGILLGVAAASIPLLFMYSMLDSFVMDRVALLLKGRGDILQTMHALTLSQVGQGIVLLPFLLILPFLSYPLAFLLATLFFFYQFVMRAQAIGKVHNFNLLISSGAVILSGAAMSFLIGGMAALVSVLADLPI